MSKITISKNVAPSGTIFDRVEHNVKKMLENRHPREFIIVFGHCLTLFAEFYLKIVL